MTRWGRLITQLTGFAVEEDPEEMALRRYEAGEGPPDAHSPSYEAMPNHWLTTLTPEALREIRDRDMTDDRDSAKLASRDRAVLLRALDEAMSAAEDC